MRRKRDCHLVTLSPGTYSFHQHYLKEATMAKQAEMAARTLPVRRLRLSRQERHDLRNGLLFAAPGILGLLFFVAYPILASVYYSFTSYNILQPGHWVGFDNYREL